MTEPSGFLRKSTENGGLTEVGEESSDPKIIAAANRLKEEFRDQILACDGVSIDKTGIKVDMGWRDIKLVLDFIRMAKAALKE